MFVQTDKSIQQFIQKPNHLTITNVQSVQSSDKTYPGICNLCSSQYHITANCQFSLILYHATNRSALTSILENGLIPRRGRLGKAVYCSDDQLMCIKFVYQNLQKFNDPILLKLKVYATQFKQLKHQEQIKSMTMKQFKQKNIQYIKCPYYQIKGNQQNKSKTLYQFALYKVNYAVIAYSPIKFPNQKIQTKNIPVVLTDEMTAKLRNEKQKNQKNMNDQKSTEQQEEIQQKQKQEIKQKDKVQKNMNDQKQTEQEEEIQQKKYIQIEQQNKVQKNMNDQKQIEQEEGIQQKKFLQIEQQHKVQKNKMSSNEMDIEIQQNIQPEVLMSKKSSTQSTQSQYIQLSQQQQKDDKQENDEYVIQMDDDRQRKIRKKKRIKKGQKEQNKKVRIKTNQCRQKLNIQKIIIKKKKGIKRVDNNLLKLNRQMGEQQKQIIINKIISI